MVARVFAQIRRMGQQNDTLAIFLSDNGFLWGEHGLSGDLLESESSAIGVSGKRYPYLPSVRIPLAIRWPGHIPGGVRDDGFASTVDLAPTIMQAAGVSQPTDPPMDGRSLLLPGGDGLAPGPSSAYLEYFNDPIYPTIPSWSSIVSKDLQYVRWFDGQGRTIAREYYDRANDPFELANLLGDATSANDPATGELDARIERNRTCVGTTGARGCR
jgi:arylsulfatase A-like enzyme